MLTYPNRKEPNAALAAAVNPQLPSSAPPLVKGVGRNAAGRCLLKAVTCLAVLALSGTSMAYGQEAAGDSLSLLPKVEAPKVAARAEKKIEITQSLQLWNVYTLESLGDEAREQRNDMYIRRGRLGVKGKLQQDLNFNIAFAYDGIGRDKKTAGHGSPNPEDNHDFFLWEALLTWTPNPMLNLAAGYFRPQVGRENITAAFKTLSFEKSLSNFQPRAHTIGRSTGRELGLNLGGLHQAAGWSVHYNLGLFDMSAKKLIGEGTRSLPMLASRLAFTLGDPEMDTWGLGYTHSYYGKRKGITLGLNSTYQSETEVFTRNSFFGADLLANWAGWDLTVEYNWLYRSTLLPAETNDLGAPQTAITTDLVCTYKLGYNFLLPNGKILQAAGMYSGQWADDDSQSPGLNPLTGASDQQVYDVGLNYLINHDKLKLSMHYVWGDRMGNAPEHRYAYLGTGFQYLF